MESRVEGPPIFLSRISGSVLAVFNASLLNSFLAIEFEETRSFLVEPAQILPVSYAKTLKFGYERLVWDDAACGQLVPGSAHRIGATGGAMHS